ncbi:hypothetical protein ACQKWADRAFT_288279 [Trichoderma austrokoningii]
MISSRSPWGLRLASSSHRSAAHTQRRFKTFVRRIDKNNEIYYTISNKRPPRSPDSLPVRDDFFEMPDLLLDLDAEDSRFVRPVDEADDLRLERKWDVNPKRLAVQDQLKELQAQISESRRKADDVLSNPTNIWRLSPHDILSAALGGKSPTMTPEPSRGLGQLTSGHDSGLIETLCRENGIPSHALQDDQVLMEWMWLRYKNLQRSMENRSEEPLSPAQLSDALKAQTSLIGIRRLLFHSLRSLEVTKSYFPRQRPSHGPNVPLEIRSACVRVLAQHPDKAAAHLEILGFLGNLAARLWDHQGPAITGLALRLSAEAGVVAAISEWLRRGFTVRAWDGHRAASADVAEALKTLIRQLNCGLYAVHDRQLLFQLLTGIEHDSLSDTSFRALPLFYLGEQSRVSTDDAYAMYESYIMLLGHLGAVRTLWKEWNASRPIVERFLKPDGSAQRLESLYEASLCSALYVAAPMDTQGFPDMELSECAALDYHSIGAQDSASWFADESSGSASPELPSFNLPLDEWTGRIDSIIRQDALSS